MDQILIETSLVKSLFKCSLCNNFIHLATVINECFHRFCKLCIMNHFEKHNNTCPECHIIIDHPLQALKFDLTFQRLLYKILPNIFQSEIACKSSQLAINESTYIQIETKINVYIEHWDISLDLFPNESRPILSKCYLECQAGTTLLAIERFLRIKYELESNLKIDLFCQSFLLNINTERLIDLCYCFDISDKNSSINLQFTVSPYGYKTLMKRLRQSKQSIPLENESSINSSLSSTDSALKVKLCRSSNNWYIPQSKPSIELPDLINSCENRKENKKIMPIKKKSIINKSRRRIRFIPTMVKVPPSILDHLSTKQYNIDIFQSNDMMDENHTFDIKQTLSNQKTICKVPPYIPEISSYEDDAPLDLSLKINE